MATPALRAFREHFVGAEIIAVLKPYVADVLAGCPWIDRQIHVDRRLFGHGSWFDVARRLREEKIDVAALFPNSFRHALIAWWGHCKRRVGFIRYGRSFLLTHRLEPNLDDRGRPVPSPIIDDYNRIAELAGCPQPSRRMELFTTLADEDAADAVWRQNRFEAASEVVCLNPGAAFGSAKHWPARHFAELARMLVDQRGGRVLVLCGPGERDLAREIVRLSERDGVASLADRSISLGLTKACVRRADLLVTTDSGPRHFAAAFDRQVVTLFGPTHIAWTETYHRRAVHLQKSVPCGPCQRRTCPLDHRCMDDLRPVDVFEAATRLLSEQRLLSAAG
jgi:heptosyltransferase-2